MRAENLERRLSKMRQEYFEGMERRISDYNTFGFVADKKFTKWEGKLNKKLTLLRAELAQAKPEKYHFGRMNKSCALNKKIHKISKYGDNGFVICEKCKEMFEWNWKDKDMRWRETFHDCGEHEGMKSIGRVKVRIDAEEFYGL